MSAFKFLHAADLHLDSPLVGLRDRDGDIGERIARASKTALNNLINLAIDEQCKFVVLAGDIFDGDIRNFQSALHFAKQMRRLKEANIPVFIALGNHDAENKFMARLDLGDNVHVFASRKPETIRFDDIAVALHGQSFPKRDVTDNIAATTPRLCQVISMSVFCTPLARAGRNITLRMRHAHSSNSSTMATAIGRSVTCIGTKF